MSKRIAFDVDSDDLRAALEEYARTRGLKLADLARSALYTQVRRSKPTDPILQDRLQAIF